MKKTLIALTASAACASALTVSTEDMTGYAIVSGDSVADWTLSGLTAQSNKNGTVTLSGDIAKTVLVSDKERTHTTIALTLDVSKLSVPTAGTDEQGNPTVTSNALLTLDGSTDIGFGINSNKQITGMWGDNTNYMQAGSTNGYTSLTLIFTFADNGTALHYAPNGTYTNGTFWSNSGLKGNVGNISDMTLSTDLISAITSIAVWSGQGNRADNDLAVSAINALGSIPVVPEPTTATLSLLALAGLAARRRRK